jgi:hypothetical protein
MKIEWSDAKAENGRVAKVRCFDSAEETFGKNEAEDPPNIVRISSDFGIM